MWEVTPVAIFLIRARSILGRRVYAKETRHGLVWFSRKDGFIVLRRIFFACSLAAILLLGGSFCVAQQTGPQSDEQSIVQAINRERADRGLGPLRWDDGLARAAVAHAQAMTAHSDLSHQYPGEADLVTRAGQQGAHFAVVAENIAMGPDPMNLEDQWMHSAPHRANILDPRLNAIGVGLVKHGGYYYGVADFAAGVAELGPQQIEKQVGALLAQHGIQPSGPEQDARQTCEMDHGTAGGSSPKFVMRWESSNLSELPAVLLQQLQTGKYHTAAVGACDSQNPQQGFTTYRVAVLLY
jgi:hypothetical protein